MRIYFVEINNITKRYNKEFFNSYCDRIFQSKKRFYEYAIGRFLIKNVAKNIYNLTDCDILTDNSGKPFIKNSDIHFSLSHSNDYVVACFDNNMCGVDLELIKPRKIEHLQKRYNKHFKDLNDFYSFWTFKEAQYKLGTEANGIYNTIFAKNYMLCAVSNRKIIKTPEIIDYSRDFM